MNTGAGRAGARVVVLTVDVAAGEAIAFACGRRGLPVEVMDRASGANIDADVLILDLRQDVTDLLDTAVARAAARFRRVVALGEPVDSRANGIRPDVWVGLDADIAALVTAVTSTERVRRPARATTDHDTERLTPRERQIMQLLLAGLSTEAVATELGIVENTVRTHLQNVISKLGVSGRAEAAAWALRAGLLPAEAGPKVAT